MQIKFVCLNLWLGGKLLEHIIEFLKNENPDILVVQEAYNGDSSISENRFHSVDVLKNELGLPYSYFSPACLDACPEGRVENGNAILSRFPIEQSGSLFFDLPFQERSIIDGPLGDYSLTPRNIQHTTITVGSKTLTVFNTQGIWGLDGGDNERRLKMSDVIVREITGKENVILAGDFNLKPNTQTILNIERHLKNVFKDELKTTFNMKRKSNPGYADAVVDMIFISDTVKTISHSCPDVDISDHLPLVCIFEI